MARPCTVCNHPKRDEIHAALDAGEGLNKTAAAFGLAPSSLKRHAAAHRGPEEASTPSKLPKPQPEPEPPPVAPSVPAAAPSSPGDSGPPTPRSGTHPIEAIGGHAGEAGRPCEVCRSPVREQIERAILGDGTLLGASKLPGAPSRRSMRRHRDSCMTEVLEAKRDQITAGLATTARAKLEELLERLERLVRQMEEAWPKDQAHPEGKALRDYLALVREVRPCIELLGRITGELRPDVSINVVLASPEWKRVQAAIVAALHPWPDALEAAAQSLEVIESGDVTALPSAMEGLGG